MFDTAAVRELMLSAFNDEELGTFCFDYFRPVYEDFAPGMTKPQKIQRLLEYAERRGQMEALLDSVARGTPISIVALLID